MHVTECISPYVICQTMSWYWQGWTSQHLLLEIYGHMGNFPWNYSQRLIKLKRCEYPSWRHWKFQSDNRNAEPGFGAFVRMQRETSPQKMLSQQAEVQSLNSLLFQARACLAKVSSKDADLNPFSLDALSAVPTPGSGPPVLWGLHPSLGINSFEDPIKNVHTDCQASFVDWSQPFQCIWEVTRCYFWSWCGVDRHICALSFSRQHPKHSPHCLPEKASVLLLGPLSRCLSHF